MFVICTPEQSDAMLQELVSLEKQLFSELGLHFKVPPVADAPCVFEFMSVFLPQQSGHCLTDHAVLCSC